MSDDPPLVSVVVPAYDEAAVVDDTLHRLVTQLVTLEPRFRWEIVVVDDGSTDATGEIAERFAADHAGVRVLRHPSNLRLGRALRTGFGATTGEYVAVLDCDLSYSPDHVARMLDAARATGAQIVIASPYMRGGTTTDVPFVRRVLSRGANRLLAVADGGGLTTLTGMVRVYDGPFVRSLHLLCDDGDVNIEIIDGARATHALVVEVPAHLDWSFTLTHGHRRAVGGRLGPATVSSLRWAVRLARRRTRRSGPDAGPGTGGPEPGGR